MLKAYKNDLKKVPYWHKVDVGFSSEQSETWRKCIYCGTLLNELDEKRDKLKNYGFGESTKKLNACLTCGWWFVLKSFSAMSGCGVTRSGLSATIGIMLASDLRPIEQAIPVIKKYLQKHSDKVRDLSPTQLEVLLRDILSDFFACDLKWTGRGPDGGCDLFGIINDQLTIIQVKRRTTPKAESVIAIRELFGTMVVNGASRGIFVSTAPKFSAYAKDEIASPNVAALGFKLELINYDTLRDIIENATAKEKGYPWSAEFKG